MFLAKKTFKKSKKFLKKPLTYPRFGGILKTRKGQGVKEMANDRTFKANKDFGEVVITLHPENGSIRILYSIDGSKPLTAFRLADDKKALVLCSDITIKKGAHKGKKCGGFKLDNYEEIKKAYCDLLKSLKEEAEAKKQEKIESIKAGKVKIELHYIDGEYLSGYRVFGEEAELLGELGLAKHIDGWGWHVSGKAVEVLGKSFVYAEAAEYAKPALEGKAARKAALEKKKRDIFEKARETNEPQLLASWSDDCDDPKEACDLDMVYEYAMPDGSIKRERHHTW